MTRLLLSLGLAAACLAPLPAAADDAERLAGQSKSAFLDAYEESFLAALELSDQLIERFDPAYAGMLDTETPVTEAERTSFACLYDAAEAEGHLRALAIYALSFEEIAARAEADPAFDYVDLALDASVGETGASPEGSQVVASAMQACGTIPLSQERMQLTDAFWADLQAAAVERGYFDEE